MITENPRRAPASSDAAAQWLHRVRKLQGDYLQFTQEFCAALQQTAAGGSVFPEVSWYAESTAALGRSRNELIEELQGSAWMPDFVGWELPSADCPLTRFEDSLKDLHDVSGELERQQRELLPRCTELATAAARLTARDELLMAQLDPLRQQARGLLHLLEVQPWAVADRDIQTQSEKLQSLFHLLAEAQRPIPALHGSRREGLSLAELELHFETVESSWGRRTAIAALRGLIFSGSFPGCELRISGEAGGTGLPTGTGGSGGGEVTSPPTSAAITKPATALNGVAVTTVPVISLPEIDRLPAAARREIKVEVSAPATAEQLRGLELKFSGGTRSSLLSKQPAAAVPTATPAVQLQRGTSTAELAGLAACSASLRKRAVKLWAAADDENLHSTARTPEQRRALGWRNLSVALELAGELIAERSRGSGTYRNELVEVLHLIAESQNAVRVEAEGREVIAEQEQVFHWMRTICHADSEGVRIERFMRREDRADPAANPDVSTRLQALRRKLHDHMRQEQLLKVLEGHVRSLRRDSGTDVATILVQQNSVIWQQIDSTVQNLLQAGMHENDCRVRDLLIPVVDLLPEPPAEPESGVVAASEDVDGSEEVDEFSAGFTRVLSSISSHMLRGPAAERQELDVETEDLKYVRERLAGRTIAIVGGVCRPHAAARIRKAMQLDDVRWLPATKKDRVSHFETDIRGMSLVVLITKLIGHKHNDIRDFCREIGIPWVQTPIQGGYSVNQLSRLIREQASEQLDACVY
ncbi:MAG: hypothetical protein RLZZ458_241 [Planctomycetota bacterium]